MELIKFAKVCENATLPRRANVTDAGMDLSACETVVLAPGQHAAIATGIAVSMPSSVYARVAPRSGLAFKYAIDVLAGVIDCGYTDQIKVILINHGKNDFTVNVGDRIAQLIFERIFIPNHDAVHEIPYEQLLQEAQQGASSRGLGGFGSTGISV
jgi:dUTP pyrophosphatase